MNLPELELELRRLREEAGYGNFYHAVKKLVRERLQVDAEERGQRRRYRPAEYKKLYHRQHGICPICEAEMAMPKNFPGELEMDHIDPNSPDWDSEQNRQVTHAKCNREKSSASIQEQSKRTGRSFTEIVG